MKRLSKIFPGLAFLILLLAGCNEDPTLSVLKKVSFTAPISATATDVVLTEATAASNVIAINWQAVDYFIGAPVTYSIQITTPEDTSSWAKATEKVIGDDILTASLSGEELNTLVKDLGLEPKVKSTVVIRVKSYVDRAAYSKTVSVDVTPYKIFTGYPSLWVAGDYQGWNVSVAPVIVSVNDDGIYEGYLYIPAGGTNEFKLYAQADWGPVSYGDGGNGTVIVANYAGANFKAPSDGYYLFNVNLNTMTFLLMKTSWGLIGGATPGGWDSDTQMTYNPGTQAWTVTADMKANGSFKFRANNAWQLDFGVDENGKIAYANNPLLPYVDRPQFTVPQDGNYTITLDLHEPGNYSYKIKKN